MLYTPLQRHHSYAPTHALHPTPINWAISTAKEDVQNSLDQAKKTPDGRTVFRDKDGTVYDQDGNTVEGDAVDGIVWREDAPSFPQLA